MPRPVTARPRLKVLGVPTSAGSHNGGQEKAPAALRAAGLLEALRTGGREVDDLGDQPIERHRPVERVAGVRDVDRVVAIADEAAGRVDRIRANRGVPVVLGGDCTITLGVVAGMSRHHRVGLMYFDGDADLNTPNSSGSGVLDSMGMTHLDTGKFPLATSALRRADRTRSGCSAETLLCQSHVRRAGGHRGQSRPRHRRCPHDGSGRDARRGSELTPPPQATLGWPSTGCGRRPRRRRPLSCTGGSSRSEPPRGCTPGRSWTCARSAHHSRVRRRLWRRELAWYSAHRRPGSPRFLRLMPPRDG